MAESPSDTQQSYNTLPGGAEGAVEKLVCMAVITAPHGVAGAMKLKCYTDIPKDIAAYNPFTSKTGDWSFTVRVKGEAKGQLIIAVDGVDSRERAEALRGLELYIPHNRLPEPARDEFYYEDLIGLLAISPTGSAIGKVVSVHDYGAGDILEIEMDTRAKGKKPRRELIPFNKNTVTAVDITGGSLTLDIPEDEMVIPEKEAQEAELAE